MSKTGEYIIKLREEQLLDIHFSEALEAFWEIELLEGEQKETLDR
jgi:hypothetical protein